MGTEAAASPVPLDLVLDVWHAPLDDPDPGSQAVVDLAAGEIVIAPWVGDAAGDRIIEQAVHAAAGRRDLAPNLIPAPRAPSLTLLHGGRDGAA